MIGTQKSPVTSHITHNSKMGEMGGKDEHGKCRYLALTSAHIWASFVKKETLISESTCAQCVFATVDKNVFKYRTKV